MHQDRLCSDILSSVIVTVVNCKYAVANIRVYHSSRYSHEFMIIVDD